MAKKYTRYTAEQIAFFEAHAALRTKQGKVGDEFVAKWPMESDVDPYIAPAIYTDLCVTYRERAIKAYKVRREALAKVVQPSTVAPEIAETDKSPIDAAEHITRCSPTKCNAANPGPGCPAMQGALGPVFNDALKPLGGTIDLHGCAACGGEHRGLVFDTLSPPVELRGHYFTMSAPCPTNGAEVLARMIDQYPPGEVNALRPAVASPSATTQPGTGPQVEEGGRFVGDAVVPTATLREVLGAEMVPHIETIQGIGPTVAEEIRFDSRVSESVKHIPIYLDADMYTVGAAVMTAETATLILSRVTALLNPGETHLDALDRVVARAAQADLASARTPNSFLAESVQALTDAVSTMVPLTADAIAQRDAQIAMQANYIAHLERLTGAK